MLSAGLRDDSARQHGLEGSCCWPAEAICTQSRTAKAFKAGVNGLLKTAKSAVFEAVGSGGPCDLLLVWSPELQDLPVEVKGATGDAAHANGVFQPTRETVNGRTAYRARRGGDQWLCFDPTVARWRVQTTSEKGTAEGCLSSPPTDRAVPAGVVGPWLVRVVGCLGCVAWQEEPSASVSLLEADAACAAVGAAYEALVLRRRRTNPRWEQVVTAPVIRMSRDQFSYSELAGWLADRGIEEEALLFDSDAADFVSLGGISATAHAADVAFHGGAKADGGDVRVEKATVSLDPPAPLSGTAGRHGEPGACGCHSSAVAARLLHLASELVPADRPRPFATGPGEEEPAFRCVLELLREGILESTEQLDPALKGVSWCDADAHVVAAIGGVLSAAAFAGHA